MAVLMCMMVAMHVGVKAQTALQQLCHCTVCVALHTAVETDPRLGQCLLCAAADPSADKCIHLCRREEVSQSAMSLSLSIYYF